MLKPLAVVVLALFPASQTFAAETVNIYTVDQFSSDCRQSGGTPLIFLNSAACKNSEGQTVTCLRTQNDIHACELENGLPDETAAKS